jgi:Zn-dependent protease
MSTQPRDRFQHAVIALAGPIAGSAASLAAVGVGAVINSEALVRLGVVGLALNVLNLLPLLPLDGGWVVPVITPWIWAGGIAAVALMGALRGFHWMGVLVCGLGALELGIWLHARLAEGPPPPVPFIRRALVGSLYLATLGGSAYLVVHIAPWIPSSVQFP